jgi:hypothetical protein
MKTFPFRLTSEDDLILLEAFVNEYPIVLALDTAASQTVIDWNTLILAGFNEEALAQNNSGGRDSRRSYGNLGNQYT